MLEVSGLSVSAGAFFLSDISLAVERSSCHVILGPTGSGKTVLLESIIGLKRVHTGTVTLDGVDITHLPIERRGLSYVPQDLALFPHMSVRENILYPLRIGNELPRLANGMVKELIESLGIRKILDRSIRNLSGGELQRAALARAVASGRHYLVLDEPLSSLHESLKRELWYRLKDLQRKYHLAILMVTHDLEEAFFLGDTISIILDGKLHQQGSKRDVYDRPRNAEVARFLGIGNLFNARSEGFDGNSSRVYSEELGTTLRLSDPGIGSSVTGEKPVVIGIRPEHVAIVTPGEARHQANNVIEGAIRAVFDNGATLTVIAACGPSSTSVEMTIPRSMHEKLRLEGGESISFRFPEKNLFLIAEPE